MQKKFSKFIISFLLLFTVFAVSIPMSAYAFDENYIGDKGYWFKKGESVTVSDNTFDGVLKYILDSENGCAYFYLYFTDSGIENYNDENISLTFNVENSSHAYKFAINKDGLTDDSDDGVDDAFSVYYDFSDEMCSKGAGEIFVGLQLKNKTDMKLSNSVYCGYAKSDKTVVDLLSDACLDMYVPETTKTTKATTSKSTTSKTTKQTTVKTTTAKSTKTTKTKTTKSTTKKSSKTTKKKSSASKTKSSAKASTKFTPHITRKTVTGENVENNNSNEQTQNATKFEYGESNENIAQDDAQTTASQVILSGEYKRSNQAIAAIVIAVILILAGLSMILYGSLNDKYKLTKVENSTDNDDNSAQNQKEENQNTEK